MASVMMQSDMPHLISSSPSVPVESQFQKCTSESGCPDNLYCEDRWPPSHYCFQCFDCKAVNQILPSNSCARSPSECGGCFPGYRMAGIVCIEDETKSVGNFIGHGRTPVTPKWGISTYWFGVLGFICILGVFLVFVSLFCKIKSRRRRRRHSEDRSVPEEIPLAVSQPPVQ